MDLRKTFPKENDKKVKETMHILKAERRKLLKKIKFLEDELINIKKPIRTRRLPTEPLTDKEWRAEFARKFKASLKGGDNE